MAIARWVYLLLGWIFTILGLVGVFLPLLPTTPFVILAGFFFARSSPRLQQRLLDAPVFGKYLTQWNESHTIPRDAKYKASAMILLSIGASIYWVGILWLRVGLGVLAALLIWFIWQFPERPQSESAD